MLFARTVAVCVIVFAVMTAPAQTIVDHAKAGVVQIIGVDGLSQPITSGSGFIVRHKGRMLVVTSFRVLRNRRGAIARLAVDGSSRVRLELLAALPGRGLVVLRAVEPSSFENFGARGLPLTTSAILGESVWALGFSEDAGYSGRQGLLNGLDLHRNLPELHRVDGLLGTTELHKTDAVVSSDNSGGPLLNDAGRVIGVNTFVQSDGEGLFLAVASRHVVEALDDLPIHPIGFDALRVGVVRATPTKAGPALDAPRDRPSALLNSAAAGLRRGIICKRCNGTGEVKQKKKTGTKSVGHNSTRPIFSMVDVECSTCRGSCVQRPPAVRAQLSKVVNSIAVVAEDEKYYERLMALRDLLRERVAPVSMQLNPILRDWYRDLARKPQAAQIGKVMVAFGSVEQMIDHETFWILQSTAGPLVVRDTRLVHTLDEEKVMVAGLIAGFERHKGRDAMVLQHGLVVSY